MKVGIYSCAAQGMVKCPRCWHMSYSLNYDGLCNLCVDTLLRDYPDHPSVEHIKQNLVDRGITPADNPSQTK